MHVNTTRGRIVQDPSEEVKALKEKVERLTQQLEDLTRRVPAPKAPEGKPNA